MDNEVLKLQSVISHSYVDKENEKVVTKNILPHSPSKPKLLISLHILPLQPVRLHHQHPPLFAISQPSPTCIVPVMVPS